MPMIRAACAAVALLLTAPATAAPPYTCTVTRIVDGDTFDCREGVRIRAWGIDAPEGNQPGGDFARETMAGIIGGRTLSCTGTKRNRDRVVAHCTLPGGADPERIMVERGAAWDYRQYSRGAYAREEVAARARRRGIWRDGEPVAPWDWRRARR